MMKHRFPLFVVATVFAIQCFDALGFQQVSYTPGRYVTPPLACPSFEQGSISKINGSHNHRSSSATSSAEESSKVPFPVVLWRFTRPHTIIGSALAIPALHVL